MKVEEILKTTFKDDYFKLMANIAVTSIWGQGFFLKAIKPHGLSINQHNVLRILRGRHPEALSRNTILESMFDKNSNVTRLIDKLIDKGLVERKFCPNDRRQIEVNLTEKGLKKLDEMEDLIPSLVEKYRHLTPEEVQTLNTLLDKIRE